MEKSEELDSPKDIFTENHLVGVCLDLFEAGGETVGSTLSWVLLYLSLQQKEQTECQREIDSVIGTNLCVMYWIKKIGIHDIGNSELDAMTRLTTSIFIPF